MSENKDETTPFAEQVRVVAAVLEEHDWFTPRGYAWPCCHCGMEFPSNDENEVREHVAGAVVCALDYAFPPAKGAGHE